MVATLKGWAGGGEALNAPGRLIAVAKNLGGQGDSSPPPPPPPPPTSQDGGAESPNLVGYFLVSLKMNSQDS